MRCSSVQSPHPKAYIIPYLPFSFVHLLSLAARFACIAKSDDGFPSPPFMHVEKACVSDWIWRAFRSVLTAAKIFITRRRLRRITRLEADREATAARVGVLPIEGACGHEQGKGVTYCGCVLAECRGIAFVVVFLLWGLGDL